MNKKELAEQIAGILYKNKTDEADEGCWIEGKDFYKVADLIAAAIIEAMGAKPESNQTAIISDEQLNKAWGNANFGNVSKREVVIDTLKKVAQGWGTGHTAMCIVKELGLVEERNGHDGLSDKGLMYLFNESQPKVEAMGVQPPTEQEIRNYVLDFWGYEPNIHLSAFNEDKLKDIIQIVQHFLKGVQPGMSEADNISIAADAYIDKFWYEQDRKTKQLMHMAYRAGAMSMLNNEQKVQVSDTTDDAQRYVADNQEAIEPKGE